MNSTILNKAYRWAGAMMVAGATVFTIAPSDGCTGNFQVTVDPLTSLTEGIQDELSSSQDDSYRPEEEYCFDEEALQ